MLNLMIGAASRPVRIILNVNHDKVAILSPANAASVMDNIRASKKVLSCDQMLFIGADVVGGGCGGDCQRIGVLDIAALRGMRCGAINFSLSERCEEAAIVRFQRLSPVHIYSRDTIPLERFCRVVGRDAGRRVPGLNIGGTTLSKMKGDRLGNIRHCLEDWLSANPDRAVLFLLNDHKLYSVRDVKPLQTLLAWLDAFEDAVLAIKEKGNAILAVVKEFLKRDFAWL